MPKYHFNPMTGERGICKAKPGNCPVCDEQHHFDTEEGVNQYEDGLNSKGDIDYNNLSGYSTEFLIGIKDWNKEELKDKKRVYKDFGAEIKTMQDGLTKARMDMYKAINDTREDVADLMYDKVGSTGVRDKLTMLDNGAFFYSAKEADKSLLRDEVIKSSKLSDKEKIDLLNAVKLNPKYTFRDEYSYNKIYKNKVSKEELEQIGIKDENVYKAVNSNLVRFERIRKDLSMYSAEIDDFDNQMNDVIGNHISRFSFDSDTKVDTPYMGLNERLNYIGAEYQYDMQEKIPKYKEIALKLNSVNYLENRLDALEAELDKRKTK